MFDKSPFVLWGFVIQELGRQEISLLTQNGRHPASRTPRALAQRPYLPCIFLDKNSEVIVKNRCTPLFDYSSQGKDGHMRNSKYFFSRLPLIL